MSLTDENLVAVPGMASRWVRLANGARAHYMTSGDHGPAVILLHGGLPGSSGLAGWRFMAPYLADQGFRVYCPDMPAFGLSDPRPEYWPQGMEDFVDFIDAFAEALCLDTFHLAGNSMGCMNTVNYLLAHPDKVTSFALIAGDVGDLVPEEVKPPSGAFHLTAYDGTRDGMRRMMEAIIKSGEAVTDDLVEMRYLSAAERLEAHQQFWPTLLQYRHIVPWTDQNRAARLTTKGRLDRIDIPGIYLYGQDDVLTPVEWGHVQEDHLPNVQFFYPEDCGHQGQTDRPDIFNPVFAEFFRDGRISGALADKAGVSTRRPELPLVHRA
ncbi:MULTISPECIES: alpha/beta fold hydrolase [Streptomyces]|uniref:alpha/beta fold hydrolase n=3 Tax=Streptomyces TaxID=1883 RepID=UPI0006AD38E7|nr:MULTISPECIES: alpha/beta hydrolase [Streptomyces]ALC25982.1 2-hydroxy-6-oxo-6-phenylhexa-2,4-dienoate hydrolase [Streptomyces sp. CFMR 7]MBT3081884.1 alpha/beta hydrolase [Streptomyces sp. COG20]MBT3085083.1 alpha/beta hydrolase [Streptomyces sp. CYG21]MBT3098149.1 alpha/beta hydrolase [Streptomyces sp. CBG30]MBT3105815.1 alpha/beta hydrolase [Streptomyces sp. COG19]